MAALVAATTARVPDWGGKIFCGLSRRANARGCRGGEHGRFMLALNLEAGWSAPSPDAPLVPEAGRT